jgi:phage-related protein
MRTNPIDNYFSFVMDGVSVPTSSKNFNVLVTGYVYGTPEREVEKVSIPGINGDYIYDHGKYSNIQVTYHCEIAKDFRNNIFGLNNALGRAMKSYTTLRDSYDTEHYREGRFVGLTAPEPGAYADSGKFDVIFDCKPQRFVSERDDYDITTTTDIHNPTGYPALPIIYVRSAGTFTIANLTVGGSHTMTVMQSYFDEIGGILVIDCEKKACYSQSGVNANKYVSGIFPSLEFGNNRVTISNGITMGLNPRWWTL